MVYFDSLDSRSKRETNKSPSELYYSKVGIKAQVVSISQPNFILVKDNTGEGGEGVAIFSDIFPFYSYQKLTEVIVSSWDSLANFILSSKFFVICLLSVINQTISNVAYQSYLVVTSGYEKVQSLPDRYSNTKLKFKNFIEILTDAQNRELWWIEAKIDFRRTIKKALNIISFATDIVKRLYLAIFVVSFIILLAFVNTTSTKNTSSLQKMVEADTVVSTEKMAFAASVDDLDNLAIAALNAENEPDIPTITKHAATQDDTVTSIAALYGLKTETVVFNNNLKDEIIEPGQDIYLPWADGYIYHAQSEISPASLAKIYHIGKDKIKEQNVSTLGKGGKFGKGSLVLIPLDDFDAVVKYNKEEANRLKELKEEADRRRKLALAQRTSSVSCSVLSSQKILVGFIWPTTGHISQCYHSGHKAIDIANNLGTTISATKAGTVTKSGWSNQGYGYHIVIDHGNGYKTLYAHLSSLSVKAGQTVNQGQKIGVMGSTGYSTGNHLHFEVYYQGTKMNPFFYLP